MRAAESRTGRPGLRLPSSVPRPLMVVLALALAGLAVWWLVQGIASGAPDDSWERVRARGVLRIGSDLSYPPFGFVDERGQHAGLDVDLGRALAARLGLRAEFVNLGYDGLYDALYAGQVDVLISGLVIDSLRMDDFAYTQPYFNAGQVLVVRRDGPSPQGMGDLAGLRLAVELGSDGDVEARRWARRLPGLEVQPWPDPLEALTAVEAGRADVALVDAISARAALRDHPALRISGEPVTYEPYAVVVRRRDQSLFEVMERTLNALRADWTLGQLFERWL
ncbi:MAG: hypothetical protein C4311_06095 [Chloroflexota bacterium]